MKTLIAIILFCSCQTTKPVIKGDKLFVDGVTYQILKSDAGRSYIIKDGKRINLYRHEPKNTGSYAHSDTDSITNVSSK